MKMKTIQSCSEPVSMVTGNGNAAAQIHQRKERERVRLPNGYSPKIR
jgi:hypothetical protein